jgi:hypothetical protein
MTMESSDRSKLVATNVRPVTKDALVAEAERLGMSMSALLSDWIEEKLVAAGHVLTPQIEAPPSEPLPFEEPGQPTQS